MNAPTRTPESTALATAGDIPSYDLSAGATTAAALILGPNFQRVDAFAEMMCKGNVSVPKHLRGNKGDCMAVTLQALTLGFNPFAFAQKTHLSQGGALGYEGQLVSAIVTASGAIEGDPTYEHLGDWSKVLGKIEERKSDGGGKYYVATYTKKDEEGLGVTVRARLRGEPADRELTVMMSQCWPRFSTQWATDPRQQICNLAIRKWVRLHKPSVLLGFRFDDEEDQPAARDMGPADVVQPQVDPNLLAAADAAAGKGRGAYTEFWKNCTHTQRAVLSEQTDWHEKLKARAAQVDANRTVDSPAPSPASAASSAPAAQSPAPAQAQAADSSGTTEFVANYANVFELMKKAAADKNAMALDIAADWIGEIADEKQRAELLAHHQTFQAEIAEASK